MALLSLFVCVDVWAGGMCGGRSGAGPPWNRESLKKAKPFASGAELLLSFRPRLRKPHGPWQATPG